MGDGRTAVLLVITNTEYGGGQRNFELVAASLPREQFAFHVACDPVEPFWGRMAALGVCRHAVRFERTLDLRAPGALARIIRQERIGLVHSQSRRADLAALLAARRCGVPNVCTVAARTPAFDVPTVTRWVYGRVERWMESHFDLQIAVAESVRRTLIASGVAPQRVVCIPEAVEAERFRPGVWTRETACRHLGLDPAQRWIGSLGRLIPLKGFDVLLGAAATLRDIPGLGFVLVGAGPAEASLRRLAQQLGLGDRFRLLPFAQDPAPVYAALDILTFTSLWGEGFPRVLLEGMAFGKPIIASELPASRDVLGDGATALFVPTGDAPALAAAIRQLAGDSNRREQLGASARRYAMEQYDSACVMPRVAEAYRAALHGGRG